MTITVGTSHFTSKEAAIRYYEYEGATADNINRKIAEGLIHIGKPALKPGERLAIIDNGARYAIAETGMRAAVEAVASVGFDVWMRDPGDSYMLFTDGKNIGYLQNDRLVGFTIFTVHKPNTSTGTGFQIKRHVSEFTKDMLSRAFIHSPDWCRGNAASVRKYRDMEDYRAANSFNAAYQLVAGPSFKKQ